MWRGTRRRRGEERRGGGEEYTEEKMSELVEGRTHRKMRNGRGGEESERGNRIKESEWRTRRIRVVEGKDTERGDGGEGHGGEDE
jgi:hypothetical protein